MKMAGELIVGGADIRQHTATIANGQSLSGAVDLGTNRLFAIVMPAAMTGTSLTFQASHDGSTYNNIYGDDGNELTYTTAASRYVVVSSPAKWVGVRYLKIRSGTSGAPSAEGAARSLIVVAVP
jgi:hypothetical protein